MDKWTLHVHHRDHICLVGRNGCGKSTLLKVIGGIQDVDSGTFFKTPGLRVAYLPQRLIHYQADQTALDYVLAFALEDYLADLYLTELKVPFDKRLCEMSGGEQRRLSLAATLSQNPDVLLLDEPTNHLDITSIEWLEQHLKTFKGAFIVISHDRQFSKAISNKTWWIDRGVVHQNNHGFSAFEEWSEGIWEKEEREKEWLDTQLRKEAQWLLRGVTARRKRNQGRLQKVMHMRAERRALATNSRKTIDRQNDGIHFQSFGASQMILEAKGITKSYHDRTLLKPFDLRLLKGDRIGIIGPNGIGKSTLIKILVGQIQPDTGSVRHNTQLAITYLDQMQETLDLNKTVMANVCEAGADHVVAQGESRHVVAYLKDFLFEESQIRGMTHILSGGERNRLALAKALTKPCDLLVLDEPTNDLDSDTLDLLVEILSDFKGTLLVISHDRDFLDQMVTSLIAFDQTGHAKEYVGGYQDYLRQKAAEDHDHTHKNSEKPGRGKETAHLKAERKAESPKQTRLSYSEKRELDQLPDHMQKLEDLIHDCMKKIDDPTFYQKAPHDFERTTQTLEKAREQLDQLEMRWLELDEKEKR